MGRVLSITNQKGGVGKTTTCVNLAASLAATHRKVLLIDLDPQGNASIGSGIDKNALDQTTYDLLIENAEVEELAISDTSGGFDLIPANSDLTAADVELLQMPNRESRLRMSIRRARRLYDYVLLDSPPSLSMLTVNALTAADGVLIPMQCEYYALEGLTDLLGTIKRISRVLNPDLVIEGILRTMYDPRNSLARDVSAQLIEYFGDRVYRTMVPRNVRLAEAPSHGLPALHYDRRSKGAIAYLALAGELLRRHEAEDNATGGP